MRGVFDGTKGIHPFHLGSKLLQGASGSLLKRASTFGNIIVQYPACYQSLLGNSVLGNTQISEIIQLLKKGHLYAGSDGSVKNKIGSHAYVFTSGKE